MKLSGNKIEASLLKRALLGNAAFSAICGVLIVVFDTRIASLVTHAQHHLWPLGVMLLGFAASLVWFSARPTISSTWVTSVIVADLAWVVGTIGLLIGGHSVLSTAGIWIVAVVGLLVFLFAELQWLGLRRLRSSTQNP